MRKRIHVISEKGDVYQTAFTKDENGLITPQAITSSGKIPYLQIKKTGCPVISQQKFSTMYKTNNLPFAVEEAETVGGNAAEVRMEVGDISAQRNVLRIEIRNEEITDEEILIGDAFGLIATKLSIGSIKAGVKVNGTWGVNTLTVLEKVTGSLPYRLGDIQFQGYTNAGAKSDKFYNSGFFRLAKADTLNRTTNDNEMVLTDLVYQDSYNTNIRNEQKHRFMMEGLSAYHLLVPAGETISINVKLYSTGQGYAMKKA